MKPKFNFNKVRKPAAGAGLFILIATPFVSQHEGLRLKSYLDPVGIPTICYGETENVALGDIKSKEECDTILAARLGYFGFQVDQSVIPPMSPKTHAALTSFAYNVGMGAFNKSTLLRKMNNGDMIGACYELDRWVYAKGRKLNGLVKRREAERDLCLEGL